MNRISARRSLYMLKHKKLQFFWWRISAWHWNTIGYLLWGISVLLMFATPYLAYKIHGSFVVLVFILLLLNVNWPWRFVATPYDKQDFAKWISESVYYEG